MSSLPLISTPLDPRFLTKMVTDPVSGCWNWIGAARESRYRDKVYLYPAYAEDGTPQGPASAHRYSYKVCKGEIPQGLEIDHICQNKLCVNPEHLEAVTHQVNCSRRPKSGPPKGCPMPRPQRVQADDSAITVRETSVNDVAENWARLRREAQQ